ncbi:MAG TPA: TetR/AcrR family transcriptional regulator [Gammaproteobacteria bacterium]
MAGRGTGALAGSLSSKGRARRQHILVMALQVFIDQGYANFSLRNVARQARISVGNLHYYFPNKEALLAEVFDSVREDYAEQFAALLADAGESPRERFVAVIGYLIRDLESNRTSTFFPELWALANHEPAAAELMDRLYAWEHERIAELVQALAPELDGDRLETLVLFISASIEGLTMFLGSGKPHARLVEPTVALALASYLEQVERARQAAVLAG